MDGWEKEVLKRFEKFIDVIIICIICFMLGYCINIKENNTNRPVEEILKTDSIIKVNDSIKIKVEQLDSIKDAKIIEVQTLDNDSTVKLFYELISK